MLYNVSFDICAAVVTCAAAVIMLKRKDMKSVSNRLLFLIVMMQLVSACLDIWSSVVNSYPGTYSFLYRDVLNYSFLIIHTSEACVFTCYLAAYMGIRARMGKGARFLLALPELFTCIFLLASNPFTHWMFYYDSRGIYTHGPAMWLLYAGAHFYMILSLLMVVLYRNLLTKQQKASAVFLLVLSIVPMYIQGLFMQHQLIEMFFQSIGLVGFITAVENMDELYDPVTGAPNHNAFIREMERMYTAGIQTELLLVSVAQPAYYYAASLGNTYFTGLLRSLKEWMDGFADGVRIFNCGRGNMALVRTPGSDADLSGLLKRTADRFEKEWKFRGREMLLPVRLCIIKIPDHAETARQLFQLADFSYSCNDADRTVEIVKAEELKARLERSQSVSAGVEQVKNEAGRKNLPPDLLEAMDEFLDGVASLTPAEGDIVKLYMEGYAVSEIPERAFITINTVKKHNKNIYRKLGINSREELGVYVNVFRRCGMLGEVEDLL